MFWGVAVWFWFWHDRSLFVSNVITFCLHFLLVVVALTCLLLSFAIFYYFLLFTITFDVLSLILFLSPPECRYHVYFVHLFPDLLTSV